MRAIAVTDPDAAPDRDSAVDGDSDPDADTRISVVDRPTPDPSPRAVRIDVVACGVCRGDTAVTEGRAAAYPRVPGHEVAGEITAVGDRVTDWAVGDRVAVGWHGGHCFDCPPCRRGDFVNCERQRITGLHFDGGYAEQLTAPATALVAVPDGLALSAAAPLVCAGLTAHSALADADLAAGARVAVQGIGGVGHLGLQFAAAFGFETIALSRSPTKRAAARELGADHFVDTTATDAAVALADLGGADAILATAPSSDAIAGVVDGLAPNGEVIVVGAPADPVAVAVGPMLDNRWSLRGWSAGHPGDAAAALTTAVHNDVRPRIETHPLTAAGVETALDRMLSGAVRFRGVLEP